MNSGTNLTFAWLAVSLCYVLCLMISHVLRRLESNRLCCKYFQVIPHVIFKKKKKNHIRPFHQLFWEVERVSEQISKPAFFLICSDLQSSKAKRSNSLSVWKVRCCREITKNKIQTHKYMRYTHQTHKKIHSYCTYTLGMGDMDLTLYRDISWYLLR